MARIRSIKPDLWTSEKLGSLSRDHRLLFIGLISNADDDGRLRGNPSYVKSIVFPYDPISIEIVDEQLDDLANKGLIRRYHVEGCAYLDLPGWREHQVINRPTPSALPPYLQGECVLTEPSVNAHGENSAGYGKGRGRKNPPSPLAAKLDRGSAIQRVFAHWLDTTGRDPSRTRLGAERRRVIEARLKDYPEADLIAAIDGNQLSAFHQGDNPGRKKYDDLTLILRNGAHLERFRDLTTQDDSPNPPVDSAAIDAFLESFPIDPTGFFTKNRATG